MEVISFYKAIVCPQLDYAVQALGPILIRDKLIPEKVHGRFTEMILGLRSLTYQEGLQPLNSYSLCCRSPRGDPVGTRQMLYLSKTDALLSNSSENPPIRGHGVKFKRPRALKIIKS